MKPGLDASVISIENPAGDERADHGPDAVGDKGEANVHLAQAVAVLEERRHGRDAHLPDGVVDGEKGNDGRGKPAPQDTQRSQQVDFFRRGLHRRRILLPRHSCRPFIHAQRKLRQPAQQ